MSEVAFLCRADTFWGSDQAGLAVRALDTPERLEDEIRSLVSHGRSMIIVTADLLAGRFEEVCDGLRARSPGVGLLVVPGPDGGMEGYLEHLRSRLAASLGIDVWRATAAKAAAKL